MSIEGPKGVNLPPPNLPGVGAVQPTAEERYAQERAWATLRDAPKVLAEVILLIDAHPELVAWAKASVNESVGFGR